MNKVIETLNYSVVGWSFRIGAAIFLTLTVHYIGFFSQISDDYFFLMTPSLIKRVTWELVSTLSMTSFYVAVFLLFEGLVKGILRGFKRLKEGNSDVDVSLYKINALAIATGYIAVLAATYIPTSGDSLYFPVILLVVFVLAYFVAPRLERKFPKVTLVFAPLIGPEMAVRMIIATTLSLSFIMGQGLAVSILETAPSKIFLSSHEVSAVIIDNTDAGLLVAQNGNIFFLPMHTIEKIVWSEAKL